jgi:6,7-dimethyl-8-ribityllumazine synthase
MKKELSAGLTLNNQRIAIVTARFNEFITTKLLGGAKDCLLRHGGSEDNITEVWVPGAFELPQAAQMLAKTDKFDAIICLRMCDPRSDESLRLCL